MEMFRYSTRALSNGAWGILLVVRKHWVKIYFPDVPKQLSQEPHETLHRGGNPHRTKTNISYEGHLDLCAWSRTEIKAVGVTARVGEKKCDIWTLRAEESWAPQSLPLASFSPRQGVALFPHTVCHLAFDRSASNLATSLRSWNDTSSFQMHSRTTPMRRIARETPNMIMGMFGGFGQSAEIKKIIRRW